MTTSSLPTNLLTSNASSNIFLLQSTATSTYQPLLNSSSTLLGVGSNITFINYNTLSNLPTDLLTSNSASNIFLTTSSLPTNLLTSNSASNIFLTTSSLPTNLLTSNSASNIFLTTSSLPTNLLTSNSASNIFLTTSSLPTNLLTSNSASNIFLKLSGGQLSGSIGIGTTTTSSLELYSTTQTQPRIVLSGQHFYDNTGLTTGGIAFLCGVNGLANRQLWLADSTLLASNTTNPVLRLMPNQGGITYPSVDAIATNGSTRLPLGLGGNMIILANGNVGTGLTNPSTTLQVTGTLNATTIQENGTALTSKYLQLSGGTLTGTLGIGTNALISGTTLDCRGAIWSYSLVIIDSSTLSGNSVFALGNYELMINSPTASGAAAIQTIRQGYDYNQNLTLQAISGSGNVGIGKTNPGYKLDVNGNGRVHNGTTNTDFYIGNGSASSALNLWDIGGAAWRLYTSSSNLYFTNGTVGGALNQKFYADFNGYLYLGGGANLRIGGNDGANTIYSPSASNIGITLNYATNSAGTINLGFNGGNGNILSITNTAATVSQNLIVNTKIGIGTTNPLSTLHINAGAILKVISLYDLGNNFQYTGFGATSGLIHNIPSTTDAFQFRVGTSSTTANELMRITGGGSVGIGTNNPLSKLHINAGTTLKVISLYDLGNDYQYTGLGSTSGLIHNIPSTSDSFQFRVGTSSTTANELMRITGGGSVGVGTTSPNASLELYSTSQTLPRLILSGQEYFTNANLTTGGIAFLCGVNRSGNRQLLIADSTLLASNGTNGTFRIFINSPSFGIDCMATNGDRLPMSVGGNLTILANGNVGIGTATSAYLLNLYSTSGPQLLINGTNPGVLFSNSSGGCIAQATVAAAYSTSANINDVVVRSPAGNLLILQSGTNAGTIFVTSTNVGIGVTNPSTTLQVNGTMNATTIQENGTALTSKYLQLSGGTVTGLVKFTNSSTWQTSFEIEATGSATNKYQFNVGGSTNTAIGTGSFGIYDANSGVNGYVMVFKTGNVGIGTTNPSTLLHVNGTMNATTIQENGTALASKYQSILAINSNINISNINCSNIYNSNLTTTSNLVVTTTASANSFIENGTALSSKYLNSNILPNLKKKSGFTINCSNAVTLSGTSYYKYDINLTSYTKTMYLDGVTSNLPYRTFSIKCLPISGIFSSDGNPNIAQYDIYMSSNISAGTSNLCAIGVPQSVELNQIPVSSSLFLLETTYFNYISVISTTSANINCIIEDYLN